MNETDCVLRRLSISKYEQCDRCSITAKYLKENPCGFCEKEIKAPLSGANLGQNAPVQSVALTNEPPHVPDIALQYHPPQHGYNANPPPNMAGMVAQAAYCLSKEATDTRLTQKVNYVTPADAQMTANLQAAFLKKNNRKKPAKKQTHLTVGPGNGVTVNPWPTYMLGIQYILVVGEDGLRTKKYKTAHLLGVEAFNHNDNCMAAIHTLIDKLRPMYNKALLSMFGPIPDASSGRKLVIKIPLTAKITTDISEAALSKTIGHLFQNIRELLPHPDMGLSPKRPLELVVFFEVSPASNPSITDDSPSTTPSPDVTNPEPTANTLDAPNPAGYGKKRRSAEAGLEDSKPEDTNIASKYPRIQNSYRRRFKKCTYPIMSTVSISMTEISRCKISVDWVPRFENKSLPKDTVCIEIGETWKDDLANKKGIAAGGVWCGSGYYKNCFRGVFENEDVAILQCRTYRNDLKETPVGEGDNLDILRGDLLAYRLMGDIFQSFKEKAARNAINLGLGNERRLSINSKNAFIGKVERVEGDPANKQLPYENFLCVPLLSIGIDGEYNKYCGNAGTPSNSDEISEILSAFTHHTYVVTSGTIVFTDYQGIVTPDGRCVLIDPQFHSSNEELKQVWNAGAAGVREIVEQHKCSKFCGYLGYKKEEMEYPYKPTRQKPKAAKLL